MGLRARYCSAVVYCCRWHRRSVRSMSINDRKIPPKRPRVIAQGLNMPLQSRPGFTLVELLVVLSIVGVLLSLALPAYESHILRTRLALAKSELLLLTVKQQQYFIEYRRYAADLQALGLSDPYGLDRSGRRVAANDVDRIYVLSLINASAHAYTVQASPQLHQLRELDCAILSLSSTGQRTASGTATVSECW
jgi:type IV pilus assembly protein PilE